jgi:hypothetical protein
MEEGVLQRVISICRQKSVSESQFAKMIGSNHARTILDIFIV